MRIGAPAVERESALLADAVDLGLDLVRIDAVGRFAGEAEKNRAVGAVAATGERERAVQIDHDLRRLLQFAVRCSSCANRSAARIGPTVCELDGPSPILNRSKALTNIAKPVEPFVFGAVVD